MSMRLKQNRLKMGRQQSINVVRQRLSLLTILVGIFLSWTPSAHAETFQILYDSFETPDVITVSNSVAPTGWFKEHNYSGMWDVNWGTNWITTAYGTQGIKCWQSTGFYTTNITEKLQPGATYTLTFNVGNTSTDTGVPRSGMSYTGTILAGTNVIASVTGTTSNDTLTATNAVSVTTTGASPFLGQTLRIRLKDNGTDWHYQTLFDNVRLVVDETSEYRQTLFFGK
jgi:hypothetical protein